jgi:post-segregation antitoxin (ccd killing protein)
MAVSMPGKRRKAVNLTVDHELLAVARRYDINLSKLLEISLMEEIKRHEQDDWLEKNQTAIDAYNERVARYGVFSDGLRRF